MNQHLWEEALQIAIIHRSDQNLFSLYIIYIAKLIANENIENHRLEILY